MALYSGVIQLKIILYSRFNKRKIRVIVNSSSRTSCHELFKELQILTFHSQYIYSLLMFAVKTDTFLNQNVLFIILEQDTILIWTCLSLSNNLPK